MKRFLFCIVVVLPLLVTLLFPVSATEGATVEELIIEACTYETTADLSAFKLTPNTLETILAELRVQGKLPWYTDYAFNYSYREDTGHIMTYEPKFLDKDTFDRERYEQRIAEVLDACVFEGMEDWQIALSLHDYLIANSIYDESLKKNTGYDLLVNGTTVCAGYAGVYQDLLVRSGIPCHVVTSEAMNHAWNLVQIDGAWYHVDVTWDDPHPDIYGHVRHQYFLVTDDQISEGDEPHHDWDSKIKCTSKKFTDAFFRDVESAIIYRDSNTCYLMRSENWNNHIYIRDEASQNESLLYTDKAASINFGNGEYTYFHCGLSYWNNRLYFSSLEQVYSIKTDGSDLQTHYKYNTASNKRYLVGCYVTNDTIYFSACNHNGEHKPLSEALPTTNSHTHQYTETITAATCAQPGFTISVCQCGLEAKSSFTPAGAHSYQETERSNATLSSDGFVTQVCSNCGETHTETLPRLSFFAWLLQWFQSLFSN